MDKIKKIIFDIQTKVNAKPMNYLIGLLILVVIAIVL
tara:strand:+ start:1027 stop:1137 length:111 start_codon:yes stop_codon:yes gene_type:complete